MARDELRNHMNSALDNDLSEREWEALHSRLAESDEESELWDRLRNTDQLLRVTPMVSPLPGFASRVMAAIAAMSLPGFAKRQPGVGIALGLVVAALMTIPVLSALLIVFLSVITDPSALQSVLGGAISAVGYLIELGADVIAQIDAAVADTIILPALLTTIIPLTILWGWLIWHFAGKPRARSRRPKS